MAKKDFEAGEVIYSNSSRFVKEDCRVIVSLLDVREWLEDSVHTVNRGELGREYRGVDSFTTYAKDSKREERNTTENYHDMNNYDGVAVRSIKVGERLFG